MKTTMMMTMGLCLTSAMGCAASQRNTGTPQERVQGAVWQTSPQTAEVVAGATCVELERGSSDVQDTRIAERWPNKSYGSELVGFAGEVGEGERNMLLRFDLSSVPADATIINATLELHQTVPSGGEVAIHYVASPWNEDTTWNSFASAYGAQVGHIGVGEYDPSIVAADVTEVVRMWHERHVQNHGVALRQEGGNTAFATSEAEPAMRPKLEVCYAR